MGRAQAAQRRERRQDKVAEDHTWEQVPAQVDGGMRMGRVQDAGMLLQPVQLHPGHRQAQEQDEGPGGDSQETACGSMAHPARGCRL